MRIGIVGVGAIAAHHIAALRYLKSEYDVEIIAGVNRSREHQLLVQEQHGIPQMFSDAEEMVRHARPDAVLVLVPPEGLYEATWRLLPYRLPILMEKPPGLSVADCKGLANTADRYSTPVMVAFNRRFYSVLEKALVLCEAAGGLLGLDVEATEFFRSYRDSGKLQQRELNRLLVSNSIHCIDLIRRIAGNVVSLAASSGAGRPEPYDHCYTALMETDLKVKVTYRAYWHSVGNWSFSLFAPDLRVTFLNLETAILKRRGRPDEPLQPEAWDVALKPGFVGQLRHFFECIAAGGGIHFPGCSIQDAVHTMKLVEAIQDGRLAPPEPMA